MKRPFLFLAIAPLVVLCLSISAQTHRPQADILPLMSAAPEGLGPVSLPALRQTPIAAVDVFGGQQPDLFMTGNTGSRDELYLYKWLRKSPEGAPVFEPPIRIPTDFLPKGAVVQTDDGAIRGFWIEGKNIVHTVFDKDRLEFTVKQTLSVPTKNNLRSLAVFPQKDGTYELVFEANGWSIPAKYEDQNPSSASWRPYDEAGINVQARRYTCLWAATLSGNNGKMVGNVRQLSADNKEVYFGMMQLTPVRYGGRQALVTGSRRGIFPYFEFVAGNDGMALSGRKYLSGEDGNLLFHPSIAPAVCAYDEKGGDNSHLIASGEGAVYFYQATGEFTSLGFPVYKMPVPVLQTNAMLDAGALPSPSVADWDGDGAEDLIVGNSEGFVLFYKNIGTNQEPDFLPEIRIQAAGKDIQIQAGYSGSVQGTQESRWGYVSPTVVDWNEDGLLDLILGDITGCYHIYLNKGTTQRPELEAAHPLFCEGLNLHGVWRCRAAAGKFGERMALAIVDDEGHIHQYWKIDDYHLEDGGKMKTADGSPILTHIDPAGGTGRCKLDYFDYDQDGKLDLIVGTGRRAAIPNLKTGYPLPVLGKKTQGTPLFMKNVAESGEATPVFAHPQPFYHQATGIVQPGGAHETGAVGTRLGGGKKPNLIVGNEAGRLFLLKGDNLRFMDLKEASKYRDKRNPFSNYNVQ